MTQRTGRGTKGSARRSDGRAARRMATAALVAALSAACGGDGAARDGMEGMPGMGSGGAETPAEAVDPMQTHLERMGALPADSLPATLPLHRQMVANMLARMNREMAGMNMASDVAWNATVDSIRGDLTAMPEMSTSSLADLMPAHTARVERLMAMHRAMMGM